MLTPLDIENKRFSKKINGYSVEEVDDFLDDLTADYSKSYKEATELKAKVEELTRKFTTLQSNWGNITKYFVNGTNNSRRCEKSSRTTSWTNYQGSKSYCTKTSQWFR